MESRAPWFRATARRLEDGAAVTVTVEGPGVPDLAVADLVAGLAAWARRSGAVLVPDRVAAELVELLDLAGLCRQVLGQSEQRKEPLGVEEERHGGDAPV
jgi:hypothetical protein